MRVQVALVATACGIILGAELTRTQPATPPGAATRPAIVRADKHDTSPALRDLPPLPPAVTRRQPLPPRSVRRGPGRDVPSILDPALQTAAPTSFAPTTLVSFEGVNNVDGVLPPDTNGDVGPNHYVQWVNLSFAIYSRTGALLYGPADGSTIWQGFGGPCQTTNSGDPIVLYDEHADRWLLTQFSLPNFPSGPFYQCIAVSQTGDPLGAFHRYQFSFNKLNDYPKFGVWPDGYYMAINQYTCSGVIFVNCNWAGQGVAAFPRAQMLNGAAASMVYFDLYSQDPNLGGMLPSDLDGPPPPAGAPNYYALFDDDAWGYSPDQLQIWEFRVNWTTPSSSTFTRRATLSTASFDSNLCSYSRNCVPQTGTSVKLDAIGDRLMYRLQYRNFGGYQTLVTNHTVDVNGADHAGVRWYEMRISSGTPSLYQQGTYAPDANHRWMASAAMDSAGNIAIGYNVSSAQMFPRIGFTGRKVSDPLGQVTLGETDGGVGTGSQTHSASRWGDYSLLAVDPTDGCTFWYTTEYLESTSSTGWRTRVSAFQIDGCSSGGGTDPPVGAPTDLAVTSITETQIGLGWTDNSSDETNFHVERCTGSGCTSFTEVGQTGANVTTFTDSPPSPNTYRYRVRASRSGTFSSFTNTVTAVMPPAAPSGLTATAFSSSQINLAWTDNSTNEANFHVDRCAGSGCSSFVQIAQLAAGAQSYADTGLPSEATFTYRVRATNATATVASNTAGATTPAQSVTTSMHVGGLSGSSVKVGGPNWRASVTVLVRDNNGNAVSGATMSGTWSNGYSGTGSCTTGSAGTCTVSTDNIHNRVGSVTFRVDSITHTTLTYNPSVNVQTSIVVTKP
jgi:hypothetical protein